MRYCAACRNAAMLRKLDGVQAAMVGVGLALTMLRNGGRPEDTFCEAHQAWLKKIASQTDNFLMGPTGGDDDDQE